MKELNITDRELSEIAYKMIGAAPTARYLEVSIFNEVIEIRATYHDGSMKRYSMSFARGGEE